MQGYAHRVLEANRVGDVPAVHAEAGLGPVQPVGAQNLVHAHKRRGVGHVLTVDVPVVRTAEIVFGAGAADRRKLGIVVDEEFDLAFAPPAGVGHPDRQVRAHVLTNTVHAVQNGMHTLVGHRIGASELGVEIRRVVGYVGERVVDLVVAGAGLGAAVLEREPRALSKRHFPEAIQAVVRIDRDGQRTELGKRSPAGAEEIGQRALDRRL